MPQKPVNHCSKAFCRNAKLMGDHALGVYAGKPTLYSMKNIDRLAAESSRARLISQTKNKDKNSSRDFTASFRSSPGSVDPYYIASHTSPVPLSRRKIVTTVAMAQSLRWNPYVETSSIEDINLKVKNPDHDCRCLNCSTRNCPSRMSSSSTIWRRPHRNNIMTFADTDTMTPRLIDASCGSSIVPSTRVSEVSGSFSDIAVRDTCGYTHIDQICHHPKFHPTPILKYSLKRCDYYENNAESNCSECDHSRKRHETIKDDHNQKPSRVISIKSFFRFHRRKKEVNDTEGHTTNNRRMIYNEGISDVIADQCPVCQTRSPMKVHDFRHVRGGGKSSRVDCSCNDYANHIPHSQMIDSRYHKNCKPKNRIYVYGNDEMCCIPPSLPKIKPKKTACSKPVNYFQLPNIRLPRKVLTSDINVEAFVGPRCFHRYNACGRRD